jgi:plasmid stabilization system protein ParE
VKRYLVVPEAEYDLRQIWRYLLEEAGLAIADRIQGDLLDAFEGLANLPGKGHRRRDLTSRDVLFFSVYQST